MDKLFDPELWIPLLAYGGLLIGDFVLGVLLALREGRFEWIKVGDWARKFGTTGAGLVILALLSALHAEVMAAFYPALAAAVASLVAQVAEKIPKVMA